MKWTCRRKRAFAKFDDVLLECLICFVFEFFSVVVEPLICAYVVHRVKFVLLCEIFNCHV